MEREEQQKAMKNNLSPSKLLKKRKWMENWRSGPPPDWNCKGCSLDAVLGLLGIIFGDSSWIIFTKTFQQFQEAKHIQSVMVVPVF